MGHKLAARAAAASRLAGPVAYSLSGIYIIVCMYTRTVARVHVCACTHILVHRLYVIKQLLRAGAHHVLLCTF